MSFYWKKARKFLLPSVFKYHKTQFAKRFQILDGLPPQGDSVFFLEISLSRLVLTDELTLVNKHQAKCQTQQSEN